MPTYNAAKHLRACLDSFQEQTFDNWELVCVDRGSSDRTPEILAEYAAKWGKMRIVTGGTERTAQVNRAVQETESEFLYYTGADFRVDRTLIEKAVQACKAERLDGVWIDNISEGTGFWARVRNLERLTYLGSKKFEGVRFFSRRMYEAVGGYDDDIPIFEEYDLQERLLHAGAKIGRVTGAAEYHLGEPESLAEIARKSFYYGEHYVSFLKKRGPWTLRYANPVRSTFFKHWRSFACHPILSVGFVLMLIVKYGSGALGAAKTGFRQRVTYRGGSGS